MESFRKLTLTLTMTVLILATLFLPYVRADVQLSQEFVEPIKNWSFEDIDLSVCEAQSWASNNGGWRALRSDVNEDGIVNGADTILIGNALFSKPGDSNYNPNADLNGDRYIAAADIIICGNDLWKEMGVDAFCLNDNHSWYTSGGGDYQMWQWLDSATVNAVKGKQVTFSFWFLPESVVSDGSQNYARAEIEYWFTWNHHSEVVQQNGDWVYPNQTKWYVASVITASLPSTTFAIRVYIHGKPDFQAWIDQTSLSITEIKSDTKLYGDITTNMSMALNLFQLSKRTVPPDFPDCEAFFGFSLAAEITPWTDPTYHIIDYVELRIKLITDGYVAIRNVTQSNNVNYSTNPDQTEKIENNQIVTAKGALAVIGSVILFTISPYTGLPPIGNLFLSVITKQGLSFTMSTWKSDASEPIADAPGESAIARCGYNPQGIPLAWPGVTFANERALFKVEFYSGQSVTIEATAKARFIRYVGMNTWGYSTLEKSISATLSL